MSLLFLHIVDLNIFCHRYVLKNLKPGEAVVIVDYKMKLELGMHAREIQRDWYGKHGISLHGFYVIAQVGPGERRIEVLDVWSEDTKQDAWFTQSALDVGFVPELKESQIKSWWSSYHRKQKQLADDMMEEACQLRSQQQGTFA